MNVFFGAGRSLIVHPFIYSFKTFNQIRTLLYENVSNKYLGYFETSQRLLTVHTGRVPMSSTVTALVNMFFEFKMKSTTKSDIKVVFTFGEYYCKTNFLASIKY